MQPLDLLSLSKRLGAPRNPRPGAVRVPHLLTAALCVYASCWLGLALAAPGSTRPFVWPAAGVGLACALFYGTHGIVGVFCGAIAFWLQSLSTGGLPGVTLTDLGYSVGFAASLTTHAAVGAHILRWRKLYPGDLAEPQQVTEFLLATVAVAPMIGASIIMGADLHPVAGGSQAVPAPWVNWSLSYALGTVTVLPALLGVFGVPQTAWRARRVSLSLCAVFLGLLLGVSGTIAHFTGGVAVPIEDAPSMLAAQGATESSPRQSPHNSKTMIVPAASWTILLMNLLTGCCATSLCLLVSGRQIATRRHIAARTLRLRQRVARLVRSNRDLDEYAYLVAHDLKEPLRGIRLSATFLSEDCGARLSDDGRGRLGNIIRLVERSEKLIQAILHISRIDREESAIQTVDLAAVLDDVLASLQYTLEDARVRIEVPDRLPQIRCDGTRVAEVFRNLITNAVKYNDKPHKLVEIGHHLTVRDSAPAETSSDVTFYVRDNGIGIPERHQEAAFKMFKRLHGRDAFGGGTGVGLPVVKRIVERHGGRIWMKSQPGDGTTVFFTLPKESRTAEAKSQHKDHAQDSSILTLG